MNKLDVAVIGSGPNGLAAGIYLANQGLDVKIFEAYDRVGGGTRTEELTLPGFKHDVCSAVHPMGYLSSFYSSLPLEKHGLEWMFPEVSVAHPFDNEPAALLYESIDHTCENLGVGSDSWAKLVEPFVDHYEALLSDTMKPLGIPQNPLLLSKFGLKAIRSAKGLTSGIKSERVKALFAGCAGHSILPLDKPVSAAIGLMFAITGHVVRWPIIKGGSENLALALSGYFESLGGTIEVSSPISSFNQLPDAKSYIFDLDPIQVAKIAGNELPASFCRHLMKYNYGPGVFKIDWALDGPIPWKDPNCLKASTVHVGGSFDEIARSEKDAWEGRHTENPFLILCQQSDIDPTRAPEGKRTGYAYCHVPHGSKQDMTEKIESQIERFAPGFRDTILARKAHFTNDFESYNSNFVGGAVTGGAADLSQLFFRPSVRLNPYTTPNPKIYICSASTPPGGGVHGMCGYHAAKTVLNRVFRK